MTDPTPITRAAAATLLGLSGRQVRRYEAAGILTALPPTDAEQAALAANPRAKVLARYSAAQVARVRAALDRAGGVPTQELVGFLKQHSTDPA